MGCLLFQGCYEKVEEWLDDNKHLLGTIAMCVLVIQVRPSECMRSLPVLSLSLPPAGDTRQRPQVSLVLDCTSMAFSGAASSCFLHRARLEDVSGSLAVIRYG